MIYFKEHLIPVFDIIINEDQNELYYGEIYVTRYFYNEFCKFTNNNINQVVKLESNSYSIEHVIIMGEPFFVNGYVILTYSEVIIEL